MGGEGQSNLLTCTLSASNESGRERRKQEVEKDNFYICLSCSRPQIMCSGSPHVLMHTHNTHTQGIALSAFSQS